MRLILYKSLFRKCLVTGTVVAILITKFITSRQWNIKHLIHELANVTFRSVDSELCSPVELSILYCSSHTNDGLS